MSNETNYKHAKKAVETFGTFHTAMSRLKSRLVKAKAFGDLTMSQYNVMVSLLSHGVLSLCVLSELISRSNGIMVAVIDNLTKRGFVKRERSKEDRRYKHVVLTENGRKHIESLIEHHGQAILEEMSVLSGQEQGNLQKILTKCCEETIQTLAGSEGRWGKECDQAGKQDGALRLDVGPKNNKRVKKAVETYAAFYTAQSELTSRLIKAKAFGDLSMSQYNVMAALLEHGTLRQYVLCEMISRNSCNIVVVINNLTKRGFVKREIPEEDRRYKHVVLTEDGRKHIEPLIEQYSKSVLEALSAFSEQDMDELKQILTKLAAG